MRVMPPKGARVRCRTGDFSHAIFPRMAFFVVRRTIRNSGKRNSFFPAFLINFFMSDRNGQVPNSKKNYVSGKQHPDIRVPFFVILSEVEGSLDISVRL